VTRKTTVRAIAILGGALLAGAPALAAGQNDHKAARADAVRTTNAAGPAWSAPPPPAPLVLRATDSAALEERWGIRVQGLRLTAAGYMLDFRYTVVDPAKAAPLFDRKTKPLLKDERTGAVMAVPVPPKTGALRSTNDPKAGRTYFMFFANPGQFIRPYSQVTVTIGQFSVGGLTVK
jgi:hypothetical protein